MDCVNVALHCIPARPPPKNKPNPNPLPPPPKKINKSKKQQQNKQQNKQTCVQIIFSAEVRWVDFILRCVVLSLVLIMRLMWLCSMGTQFWTPNTTKNNLALKKLALPSIVLRSAVFGFNLMLNGNKYFFITKTKVNVIMFCDPHQTPENKNNNGFQWFWLLPWH